MSDRPRPGVSSLGHGVLHDCSRPEPGPGLDEVAVAARRLVDVAVRTPVVTSQVVDRICRASVFIKAECFQRTGSFKFRGAYNRVSTLSQDELRSGVAAASSGNHAVALAHVAQLFGCSAAVLMPRTSPPVKLAAAEHTFGAEILFYDEPADRDDMLKDLLLQRGFTEVPSSNHVDVIAGQGTVALELFEDVQDIDTLVVPVAGGGLLAGCATVAAALSPSTRVIGVEPCESPDMFLSLAAGAITHCNPGATIADALKLHSPSEAGFRICQGLVPARQIVLVSNEEIRMALLLLCGPIKLAVEPAGAVALAAVMARRIPELGRRVAVIASGGNGGLTGFGQAVQVAASSRSLDASEGTAVSAQPSSFEGYPLARSQNRGMSEHVPYDGSDAVSPKGQLVPSAFELPDSK